MNIKRSLFYSFLLLTIFFKTHLLFGQIAPPIKLPDGKISYQESITELSEFSEDEQIEIKSYFKQKASLFFTQSLEALSKGNLRNSYTLLDSCIFYDENFSQAYVNRGFIFQQIKKNDKALKDYQKAIQLDSTSSNAFYGLASVRHAMGQYDSAYYAYNQIIALDSSFYMARYQKAKLLIERPTVVLQEEIGSSQAEKELLSVIEQDSSFQLPFIDLCALQITQGQLDKAFKTIQWALSLDSLSSDAYYNQGMIYLKKEETDSASYSFNKAISLEENHLASKHALALIYAQQGIHQKALTLLNEIISQNDQSAVYYNDRATIYLSEEQYQLAMQDVEKAILLDPILGEAYVNRGILREILLKGEGSCEDFNQAIKLGIDEAQKYLEDACAQ